MDSSDWRYRTGQLLGDEMLERLGHTRVALFGLGGVGGFCLEGLARMGVGHFSLVDVDTVSPSNLNRQILATRSTLGRPKAEVARERVLDINPEATVELHRHLYTARDEIPLNELVPDLVVDAIDGLNSKVHLLHRCLEQRIPVVASMGTGRRMDPTHIRIDSLTEIAGDPLASRVRKRLRKANFGQEISQLMCVWSDEKPQGEFERNPAQFEDVHGGGRKRHPMPSMVTVPGAAGLALAFLALETIRGRGGL